MEEVTFELVKRFLFDVFVVASFLITLLKMLVMELKSLKRIVSPRRR